MVGERPDVDLLLENGSENPKRIFAALNAEPTKPKKDVVILPEDAHAFIRERYASLEKSAVEEALKFLTSDEGRKQRELSQRFSDTIRGLLSGASSLPEATGPKAEKTKAFLKAAGAIDALDAVPLGEATPASRQNVLRHAIDFYAANLSDEELDSLIVHYSSPTGALGVQAVVGFTRDILRQYGI